MFQLVAQCFGTRTTEVSTNQIPHTVKKKMAKGKRGGKNQPRPRKQILAWENETYTNMNQADGKWNVCTGFAAGRS